MNKTIYVADSSLWDEAAHRAFTHKLSMSALITKLLKAWLAAEQTDDERIVEAQKREPSPLTLARRSAGLED